MSLRNSTIGLAVLIQSCASFPPHLPAGEASRDEYTFTRLFFTASPPPNSMHVLESLDEARGVRGWTRSELVLYDDQRIPIPGIDDLRAFTAILTDLTRNGVEVVDGDIIALVPISHWCGNDSVRRHDARISIPELLRFTSERSASALGKAEDSSFIRRWTIWGGWDVDEYHAFLRWQRDQPASASREAESKVLCRARIFSAGKPEGTIAFLAVLGDGRYLLAEGSEDVKRWSKNPIRNGRLPQNHFHEIQRSLPTSRESVEPPILDIDAAKDRDPLAAALTSILASHRRPLRD